MAGLPNRGRGNFSKPPSGKGDRRGGVRVPTVLPTGYSLGSLYKKVVAKAGKRTYPLAVSVGGQRQQPDLLCRPKGSELEMLSRIIVLLLSAMLTVGLTAPVALAAPPD